MTDLTTEQLDFLHGALDLARDGNAAALRELIVAGLPPNLTNAAGDSLLILAAYHDHLATVATLLELGADPDRVNDRGQTAVGAAVFRRSTESVRALLAAGADPHLGRQSGYAVADFFELPEMRAVLADPGTP